MGLGYIIINKRIVDCMQDVVKEFEQRAHWNRPVKHDPVQDLEVD